MLATRPPIRSLRALGPRLIDGLGELPYTASGSIYNDPVPPQPYLGTGVTVRELDASAVEAVLELAGPGAPVPCILDLRHLGGALARPPDVASLVRHRDARYLVRLITPLERADAAAVRPAYRRLDQALAAPATVRFLSFVYGEATAEEVRSAYEPGDYARPAALKAAYDPANTFRLNHNIPPASVTT